MHNYVACLYLVYFEDEHCVSIVVSKAIIASRIDQIKVGDRVHVKEREKVYNGILASYGTKKDLQILENKFITGEYTPEFLVDAESLHNEDSPLPKKIKLSSKLIVTKQTVFYSISIFQKRKGKKI